jgi:hypothetical protein
MDLQQLAVIDPLLKHQWPVIGSIAELHWRDFAVFVSLSSRTNTRWGVLVPSLVFAFAVPGYELGPM